MLNKNKIIELAIDKVILEINNLEKKIFTETKYKNLFEESNKNIKFKLQDMLKSSFLNYKTFIDQYFSKKTVERDLNWISKTDNFSFEFNREQLTRFLQENKSVYYLHFIVNASNYIEDIVDDWKKHLINDAVDYTIKKLRHQFDIDINPFITTYYAPIAKYENKAKKVTQNVLKNMWKQLLALPEYEYYLISFDGRGNKLLNEQINNKISSFYSHWLKVIEKIKADLVLQKQVKIIEEIKSEMIINIDSAFTLLQKIDTFSASTKEAIKFQKYQFDQTLQNKNQLFLKIEEILEEEIIESLIAEPIMYMKNHMYKLQKEIIKLIYSFIEYKNMSTTISKIFGTTWNLDIKNFKTKDISSIYEFVKLIENNSSIKKLIEILGNVENAKNQLEKNKLKNFKRNYDNYSQNYPEEFVGTKISNNISHLLLSELVYFKHPTYKKIFLAKFAEGKLQTFDYKNKDIMSIDEYSKIKNTKSDLAKNRKGPIIILVDISGSMHGKAELLAKATALALTAMANREKRKIYLVTFETDIDTLELSDTNRNLEKLNKFLSVSFGGGGTDFSSPLRHSLEILTKEDFKNADVLMISDFIGDEIEVDVVNGIKKAKKSKNNFHALLIGEKTNYNLLKGFKQVWNFNGETKEDFEILVKKLDNVSLKK
ncbi:vWA domain-containing protein [Spiroplasma endosymbiont of Labia minor]|uniref:vWA domain-containing protein n=1 Tax=Spiroplasma endosymbiont of Labia minor TaxID=3066305 RepID=UPI0030D2C982